MRNKILNLYIYTILLELVCNVYEFVIDYGSKCYLGYHLTLVDVFGA